MGNLKIPDQAAKFISPIGFFGDLSDEISGSQQFKFIADWFCISYSCAKYPACVKSEMNHLIPPWPMILPVNQIFSET
jgi:hypothetical protein